ncbi:uncharacterized protein LTR77_007611 [Saxophila tyrrhenica]|uniref:Uncharacterized protein n=1 Tax=Saxophila tyrrhenica TaxID=1690608 RepID=A0AAV9P5I7_9PEZI|nr:hypothetical protein LTR77_007611 [Saxophila tyrrhenica]
MGRLWRDLRRCCRASLRSKRRSVRHYPEEPKPTCSSGEQTQGAAQAGTAFRLSEVVRSGEQADGNYQQDTVEADPSCAEERTPVAAAATTSPEQENSHQALCSSILENKKLADQLQQAILQNRKIRKAERAAGPRLDKLDQKFHCWEAQVQETKREIKKNASELEALRGNLVRAEARRDKSLARSEQVDKKFALQWRDHSQDVDDLLLIFDEVFVTNDIMAAASEDPRDIGKLSTTSLDDSMAGTLRPLRVPPAPLLPEEQEVKRLKDRYIDQMIKLHAMATRFERQEYDFDRLRDGRDAQIAAGEEVESSTELDLNCLQDGRRNTRELAEAEEEFAAAKAAAVAAKVQLPDAEIESGFVDDVDDGYRASHDELLKLLAKPALVELWLETIPDGEIAEDPEQAAAGVDVDVDEWDAASIDISESGSMVAEGHWRRKIDSWRETCVQEWKGLGR